MYSRDAVLANSSGWLYWLTVLVDCIGWLYWLAVLVDCKGWLYWLTVLALYASLWSRMINVWKHKFSIWFHFSPRSMMLLPCLKCCLWGSLVWSKKWLQVEMGACECNRSHQSRHYMYLKKFISEYSFCRWPVFCVVRSHTVLSRSRRQAG